MTQSLRSPWQVCQSCFQESNRLSTNVVEQVTALKRCAVYSKALRLSRMLFLIVSLLGSCPGLCSHQALVHSSCLLCGQHAVEAAQGKVSQVFLQAVATR